MKIKKILTVCLVIAVLAFVFTACVGSQNGSDGNTTESVTTSVPGNESKPESTGGEVEAKDVTVRFLVNGDVYSEVTGKEGERITLPTEPSIEHKTFVEWEGYTRGERYSEAKDFVAVFTDNIYVVEFVDGTTVVSSIEGKYGETFTAPEDPAKKAGYVFNGWDGFDASNLTISESVTYVANWTEISATFARGTFDATVLTKDTVFDGALDVTDFVMVQNTNNSADEEKAYTLNVTHDKEYLYVYIFSADTDVNDNDRLSFYVVKKGETTTTNVQVYPNKGTEGASNTEICEEINAGTVEGGYALKAKIALSNLEVTVDTIPFGVRFIDKNNDVVYLSNGATADNGATKVDNAANLPVWVLASEMNLDGINTDWAGNVKTEIAGTSFTSWVGNIPTGYKCTVSFKADSQNLYIWIETVDTTLCAGTTTGDKTTYDADAFQIAFNVGNGRFFYSFDYRGNETQGYVIRQNGADNSRTATSATVYTATVQGGWAAEICISLEEIFGAGYTFNNTTNLECNVLICYLDHTNGENPVVDNAYGTFSDFVAWGDEDGMKLVLKADGTYELTVPTKVQA